MRERERERERESYPTIHQHLDIFHISYVFQTWIITGNPYLVLPVFFNVWEPMLPQGSGDRWVQPPTHTCPRRHFLSLTISNSVRENPSWLRALTRKNTPGGKHLHFLLLLFPWSYCLEIFDVTLSVCLFHSLSLSLSQMSEKYFRSIRLCILLLSKYMSSSIWLKMCNTKPLKPQNPLKNCL